MNGASFNSEQIPAQDLASAFDAAGAELQRIAAMLRNGLPGSPPASNCHGAVQTRPIYVADSPQLLTAREVAGLLRVDPRTLRAMRHAGEFPEPIRVGRALRWRQRTVEAFIVRGER